MIARYVGQDMLGRDFYVVGHVSIGVLGITKVSRFPYWHFQVIGLNGRVKQPKVY